MNGMPHDTKKINRFIRFIGSCKEDQATLLLLNDWMNETGDSFGSDAEGISEMKAYIDLIPLIQKRMKERKLAETR